MKIKHFKNSSRMYLFLLSLRPLVLRYLFLIVCVAGIMWHAVYTSYIIDRLKKEADHSTTIYAELLSAALYGKMGIESERVVLEKVIRDFNMPIIITDPEWKPIIWKNIFSGHFLYKGEIPQHDIPETRKLVNKKIRSLKKKFQPRVIFGKDKKTKMGYLVFGNSNLITGLAWMPIIEGFFVFIFAGFVYFAIHNIVVTEKSNLWVGLAKETAHQLGTPISSLMGWVEYIKTLHEGEGDVDTKTMGDQIELICNDMEKDLTRLKKISNRFNQIGSKPELKYYNLGEIIDENIKYFHGRLPTVGKHIEIRKITDEMPDIPLNRDLIDCVLENLFKNSLDAIERNEGLIEIKTEYIKRENIVRIQHIDNGRGIPRDNYNNVFSPGYTTKRRGWGLGLTLAKRIVEDYHKGRIYILWSKGGKGTAVCIDLPVKSIKTSKT